MEEEIKIENVFQFSWLTTHQLYIAKEGDTKCNNLAGWGSGFFLSHRNKIFFVTADHNIHMRDHEEGIRTGKENPVFIVNNETNMSDLSTGLTPLGGFYYYDGYNFGALWDPNTRPEDIDPELLQIPDDMPDFAFCEHSGIVQMPILTDELKCGNEIIVPAKQAKLIINSQCVAEASKDRFYVVTGTVLNEIKGLYNYRRNAIFVDITFRERDGDDLLFDYPGSLKHEEWKAISGAPLFDNHFHLVGMVVRVIEEDNAIRVIPIQRIIKAIEMQTNINSQTDPRNHATQS